MRRLILPLVAGVLMAAAPSTRWGHRAYSEAPSSDLMAAGNYRKTGRIVQLRTDAAKAFHDMVVSAQNEGVSLIPVSGFRTRKYQRSLFETARRKHNGAESQAAKWVAPPGYSEHHTGYTLDVGDGEAPTTDIETSFQNTKAFEWLKTNAARFHFELSFPEGNSQGVSYEPWHWRYIGTPAARQLFHPEAS